MQLEDTVRVIREAENRRRRRLLELERMKRPVQQVDEILHELEELHLRGGIKVPALMITRIERLLSSLPDECRAEFPLRTTITRVMDNLYAVEDCLLSRKDRRRAELQVVDSDLEREDDNTAA
jgi:hypothetical protein